MSWKDFTNYLKKKIIQAEQNAFQEEYELTPFAKEKYCLGLSQEEIDDLIANLEFLLLSYQNRFDTVSGEHHQLPTIEKEEEEVESSDEESGEEKNEFATPKKPTLKTWVELYPTRQDCLLGRSENEAVSRETYNLLGRIYEDWQSKENKVKELGKWAKKWDKTSKKLIKEWASEQAREFFRKKRLNTLAELKSWVADYENLSQEQQNGLTREANEIKEQLELLGAEEYKEEKGWFKNLDWKSIFVSTGIGLVVILIILVIKKYIFR